MLLIAKQINLQIMSQNLQEGIFVWILLALASAWHFLVIHWLHKFIVWFNKELISFGDHDLIFNVTAVEKLKIHG